MCMPIHSTCKVLAILLVRKILYALIRNGYIEFVYSSTNVVKSLVRHDKNRKLCLDRIPFGIIGIRATGKVETDLFQS